MALLTVGIGMSMSMIMSLRKNDLASSNSSRVEVCGRYHSSDEEGENGSGNKNETMVAESCATRSRFWYGVWSTWTNGERN